MTPSEFAAKWSGSSRNERAASQEHFIDLCRMLGVQTPNEADPHGTWYAFEKGAQKTAGGNGFADVWKREHFAWEYKGKHKDLDTAYKQLLDYREALENPPLLVVSDLNRFEVHTNYVSSKKSVYAFNLADLRNAPAEPLRVLRAVFSSPDALRPDQAPEVVTEEAARRFAELAGRLQSRGHAPLAVAHFLNRLLFCLFAEDVGLLPLSLFARLVEGLRHDPEVFDKQLRELFGLMSKAGGHFGIDRIYWFNGGLFDDAMTIPLDSDDIAILGAAARLDWAAIEPSILGTLFERGLDPEKRGQLGAHYTDRHSILRVIEPVVLEPLRAEVEAAKAEILELKRKRDAKRKPGARSRTVAPEIGRFRTLLDRLRGVRVLDPACGSGNFLYVALQKLKELERDVIHWGAETLGVPLETPGIGPDNVLGIELSPYAAELARTTIWIGQIQWMVANGFSYPTDPVLRALNSVENRDAILNVHDPDHPRRAIWPAAEFVVGNPPFIGSRLLRTKLGDPYVDQLYAAWDGEVPKGADLVCYWHEAARDAIATKRTRRAGLLATQAIRGGDSQRVLKKILDTGGIFEAWQDEEWVVEGAAVHLSIVCQDDGGQNQKRLDGVAVETIHADLTGGSGATGDLTTAMRLAENLGTAFMGDTKGGAFDISGDTARELLIRSGNPNGRPNSDVIAPWVNGRDLAARTRDMFIIDFGTNTAERDAALFEGPFQYLAQHVRGARDQSRTTISAWWLHERPRGELRAALQHLDRFIATPRVAKHRLFVWLDSVVLPDSALIAIAREDDYAFGVLHSRVHETWSLSKGTQLEDRPRYTPTSTFETFPFPWPLATPLRDLSTAQLALHDRISAAAKALDSAREAWLNPPEWIQLEADVVESLPARKLPVDDRAASELKKRTLTNLYNQNPVWLRHLHAELDAAVLAAYGWAVDITEPDLLGNLLRLNHARAAAQNRQGSLA